MQGCGADDVTFMYHLPMSVALWHGSRAEPEREPQPALSLARPGLMLILHCIKNSTKLERTVRVPTCASVRIQHAPMLYHRAHNTQQRCTDDGHHHNVQHQGYTKGIN
jgi:hypothetical protein